MGNPKESVSDILGAPILCSVYEISDEKFPRGEHALCLGGLGHPAFQTQIDNLKRVDDVLHNEFEQYTTWQPGLDDMITVSCRPATPVAQCKARFPSTFPVVSSMFDPFGQLANCIRNKSHVFLDENNLGLYQINSAKTSVINASPSNFKTGCVVEAQVSFCAIKVGNTHYMKILVRELLMQDNAFAMVSFFSFTMARVNTLHRNSVGISTGVLNANVYLRTLSLNLGVRSGTRDTSPRRRLPDPSYQTPQSREWRA